MNIVEAAKKTGVTPTILRHYERVGFIPPVQRNSDGSRVFNSKDIEWIRFVQCMKSVGLSIESLIEYSTLCKEGQDTILARKELLTEEHEKLQCRCNEMTDTLVQLSNRIESYDQENTECYP
ncbi:MerR family transcriptional regulator [Enterococcus sp. AZ109]|uniref:MerR family transcriptional regulator n=1 Tax=Enterococcus sp. AZ109 TaxID=2774634 RepID=UPI003F209736